MAGDAGMTEAEVRQTAIDARRVADEAIAAKPPQVVVERKPRIPSPRGTLRASTSGLAVAKPHHKIAPAPEGLIRDFDQAFAQKPIAHCSKKDIIGAIVNQAHADKPTQTRVATVRPSKPERLPSPYT